MEKVKGIMKSTDQNKGCGGTGATTVHFLAEKEADEEAENVWLLYFGRLTHRNAYGCETLNGFDDA